uniref:Family with sequence similarity 124B n=1 Tax=Takifugu rubripes TaxID=31033 RepID=A0A674NX53_TAKRU
MFPGAALLKGSEDEYPDSGAETAGSDCSRMPSSGSELRTRQTMQQEKQRPHRMHLHLLANPGDSLLLQHTLDHLIRWLYPSLRIFHVSERASSFRTSARACPTAEPGLCMQLALKQLSPGVRAKPCNSAVLQFRVEEIGQLVPLLPNPCSPISNTRWQTEDLDGNKVLFQVKPPAQPERPLTCAFPLTCPSTSSAGTQHRSSGQGHVFPPRSLAAHGQGVHVPHAELLLDTFPGAAASLESGSCSSIPSGSSSYSSQNSSPSPFSTTSTNTNSLLRPSITRSFSHLLLEEAEEETNVDTGVPASVQSIARSASTELLLAPSSESPKAVGPPFPGGLSKVLMECLPQIQIDLQGSARKCPKVATRGKERPTEGPGHGACTESRTMAELLSARMYRYESVDEFFI